MKQHIFFTIAAILMSITLPAQTEIGTAAGNKLNGPVKSVTTSVNWLKEMFGELEISRPYYKEAMHFDKAGRITGSTWSEDIFERSYRFEYNKKGLLKEKTYTHKTGKKSQSMRYTFVHDDAGKQTEEDFFSTSGKFAWKKKFHYEDGNLKQIIHYNEDGGKSITEDFVYEEGHLSKHVFTNSMKEVYKTVVYKYDSSGQLTREDLYEKKGSDYAMTSVVRVVRDGRIVSETTTISEKGKHKNKVQEFDAWGNVVKLVEVSGTVYTTVYTFDQHNNWITATTSFKGFDGPAHFRKDRTILYY